MMGQYFVWERSKLEDIISTSPHGENIIYDIHSRISSEEILKVGVNFQTEEDVYEVYKAYARQAKFGIRRSRTHRDTKDKILDRTFRGSCEGKQPSDKRDDSVSHHPIHDLVLKQ